ncbi:MAG: DNA primase [Rikenellaceae bacterium]
MIDKETVDRIYAAANIVEIIGDYVPLKRKGVNYQACCPFHNEKTASFVVSPTKGFYRCFGCGKGGSAVTFVMEYESASYPEALKIIAKRYGIEVKDREMSKEDIERNDSRESMFALNGWVSEYFANYLTKEVEGMSIGLSYFRQSRGFSEETIKKFSLGFCPAKGDIMSRAAEAAGYKQEFLVSTGLSILRESDNSIFDRFRDRVIFPVHNISGRVVAFGGRTLRTDKKVAKYLNSPESEIYSKKRELYGLYFAKRAIQQHDVVIMVEGYTDVISMHQSGIENVVSSSGTSLTVEQVRLLSRFTKNITIIYDGDAAGVKAAIRGIDIVLREGMNVRIVSLPPEHDPDSFAKAHTAQEVQDYIRANEEDFLTFKAKLLLGEAKGDPSKRADMVNEMVISICQITDPIRRSIFAAECSRIMDVDEAVILSEVTRKVAMAGGDRETANFLRNQGQRQRSSNYSSGRSSHPVAPPDDLFCYDDDPAAAATPRQIPSLEFGSSIYVIEAELLKYLLLHGHKEVDFVDGAQVMSLNVAATIFADLDDVDNGFSTPVHSEILRIYREQWERLGVGVEVPASTFLQSDDKDLCNRAVEILSSDDNYVMSQIWTQRNLPTGSGTEVLAAGIAKSSMLYKSKSLDRMIREQHKLLQSLTDETEQLAVVQEIMRLNAIKVTLAHQSKRMIL